MTNDNLNLPNAISALRIALVPVLAFLAWRGHGGAFTILLAATLAMDFLDGYLARVLDQRTALGARLDSWGDLLTVLVYAGAAPSLQPALLRQNTAWVALATLAYFSPILLGLVKFGRLTSYHTRLMTVTAYAMGAAVVSFFAGWSDVPLRVACVALMVGEAEEIAITIVLPEWQANVRDLRQALATRRERASQRYGGRSYR
jgi:phosphatidylglycerophosphate synthase